MSRRSLVISLLITAILSRPAGVQRPGHHYREGDPGGKKGGAASHAGRRGSADQLLRNRLQRHGPTNRNRHISFSFSALTDGRRLMSQLTRQRWSFKNSRIIYFHKLAENFIICNNNDYRDKLYMNNAIPEFIFASCFGSNLIKD